MRYSTQLSLFLALHVAQDVLAGPTLTHLHRHVHQKKDGENINWNALDWNNMGIDWASAYAKGQSEKSDSGHADHAPSLNTPGAVVQPSPNAGTSPHLNGEDSTIQPTPSDDQRSIDNGDKKSPPHATLWRNLVGHSNHRKVFGLSTPTRGKEVSYVSNVGQPEGSNMIKVDSASDHTFTNEFINTSKEPMTVVVWNKAASKNMNDPLNADPNLGASIAPNHAALTIPLDPGESQTVAFLDQSVVAWAQATESRAASGGFSTTWGEAQFNTTGSGYDVSAIQNPNGSNYIMEITSVEASNCASTHSKNMWITETKTVGSGSCYIAQNVAHLTTKMGGLAS